MDYIYEAVCERLDSKAALFEQVALQPIRHIDYFKGQYQQPELHEIYELPAVFMDYSVNWEDESNNTQKGTATIRIHIELDNIGESANRSSTKAQALEIFRYYQLVNVLLHGLQGESFTKLKRRSEEPDLNPTATHVHIITYTCEVEDDSTHIYRDYIYELLDELELKRQSRQPQPHDDEPKYHI
jgi:hypothetical protein